MMWKTLEEIGDTIYIAADTGDTNNFWLVLGKDKDESDNLYLWCDPVGIRVLAFKEKNDAEALAFELETDEMETFIDYQEDFTKENTLH